jgi:hypothetical protein
MEKLIGLHESVLELGGGSPVIYFLVGFIALVAITGQWMLYYKCDLPGVACIVPVWNVTTFLKIMGRPAWQVIIIMIPPPIIFWGLIMNPGALGYSLAALSVIVWAGYMARVYYELLYCFNKTSTLDFILCYSLNGLYVLWLGMADTTEYQGTYQEVKARESSE